MKRYKYTDDRYLYIKGTHGERIKLCLGEKIRILFAKGTFVKP